MVENYERHHDDDDDRSELDHRLDRIDRVKNGCNGLDERQKLQANAENIFELTCSWELGSDALKAKIDKQGEKTQQQIGKLQTDIEAMISSKIAALGVCAKSQPRLSKDANWWDKFVFFVKNSQNLSIFILVTVLAMCLLNSTGVFDKILRILGK